MKKVIIIDERQERKKLHLSAESLSELAHLEKEGILTIASEIPPTDSLDSLLGNYEIVAVHRSYLANTSMFNSFNEYIKRSKKYFFVFSGGISQNTLSNKGHQLNINSSDFYSIELPIFIKKINFEEFAESPLLQFLYGDSWRLTLLLQYRYLLWTYGDIDEIDDEFDDSLAEELQDILWNGDSSKTIEEVTFEIEKEKERRINL